jgi:hypothetical protein
MPGSEREREKSEALRRLRKHEIDRQIEEVLREVAGGEAPGSEDGDAESGSLRPRWISPRCLAERMRPFLVLN